MKPSLPSSTAVTDAPRRRRILLVSCAAGALEPTGGLEIFLLRLAAELGASHDVTMCSHPGPDGTDVPYQRPTERFERFEPSSVDVLDRLARNHDLVLINQWRYLVTSPERTVLMLHGGVQQCYPEELATVGGRRRLVEELARPAALAACSSWAAGTLAEVAGRETHVLYPPIDPAFLETPSREKRPVIGYVGRLSHLKGVDLLPQIARHEGIGGLEVEATRFTPDAGLETVFADAFSSGLVRSVEPFTDPALLADYRASLSALVVPSRIEGFGLSALEAQAAGTFVVASSAGGLRESVLHGGGILTDGTVDELVKGLRTHHGKRPTDAVRARIRSRFTAAATTDRLLSLL